MLILEKAANLDVGYSPNLGAILLFHLAYQSNCSQGDIVCGGVITMLANSLSLDYTNLRPIVGNTLVNINVLSSATMVMVRRRCYCIRIPGVEYLLPTPMPNHFSIENKILNYVPRKEMQHLTKRPLNWNKLMKKNSPPTRKRSSPKNKHQ